MATSIKSTRRSVVTTRDVQPPTTTNERDAFSGQWSQPLWNVLSVQ
jgi:hypothetical protein